MDKQEIIKTPIWCLYEQGNDYHSRMGIYADTDRNYRFYNGNQLEGLKVEGVELAQKNFIKPIVKHKVSVIHENLYQIVYTSDSVDDGEFSAVAEDYCKMLNRYAARIWERDKMDQKGRSVTKDAAINDEGIIYVDFDKDAKLPMNRIVDKNDVYYGNENDDDIQSQPYILLKRRMTVAEAQEFAQGYGVGREKLSLIVGDNDTVYESGDAGKVERDNGVTVVYKFYREKGIVKYSIATRLCEITNNQSMGLVRYPFAHLIWEEKKGSARGEGEVRNLIPNQIEVNKTVMRRIVTVKHHAYEQKVVNTKYFENPQEFNKVGGVIETNGEMIEDISKAVTVIKPSTMSPDVVALEQGLINDSRELAGAGEVVTGSINPENTSGKAILAVQQAQRAPLTEQKERYKNFVEDIALIWLDYLTVHSAGGMKMQKVVKDADGKESIEMGEIVQATLKSLKASVKIEITPKGPYDRLAQEQSLENFLAGGWFNPEKLNELEAYVKALDDDSSTPKKKILEIIANAREEQKKIVEIEQKAHLLQQQKQKLLGGVMPLQTAQ